MMVYAGGNRHYVGSTYNFMSNLYLRMLDAYYACNFEKLTTLEAEATSIYQVLNDYHSLVAGKEIMKQLGIDCGPVRKPLRNLTSEQKKEMVERLRKTTLFELSNKEKKARVESRN